MAAFHSASPVTASHNQHLTAVTNFGLSIDCDSCHTLANNANHINEAINFTAEAASYDGDTTVPGSTYGSCGTNNCHNNGKNGVTYNDGNVSYTIQFAAALGSRRAANSSKKSATPRSPVSTPAS